VDLRRQLSLLRAWLWLLLLCAVLAGGTAYLGSRALPKSYEARATLMVGQSLESADTDYNQILASQRLSQTYAAIVTTRPLLQRAVERLGADQELGQIAGAARAEAPRESTLVRITVRHERPGIASAFANALAKELVIEATALQGRERDVQQFAEAELRATQAQIRATRAEIDSLTLIATRTPDQESQLRAAQDRLIRQQATYGSLLAYSSGSAANLLKIVEPAVPPGQPAAPQPLLNAMLAAILGLVVAIGLVFLFEHIDASVKTPDDVEELTGLPTLGAIARMQGDDRRSPIYRLAALLYPRSGIAEAFRTLRTNIEFTSLDAPLRTIVVTSSIPSEGKTTVASNLAVVFAQAGHRTLLVDADLRKPGVHELFDLRNDRGLTDLLRSEDLSIDAVAQSVEQVNLRVIATGALPPNPAELIRSHRMEALIERLKGEADLVIFDSPPLQAVTDAALLAAEVDGTLFVIRAGTTHRNLVKQAREALQRVGAPVLGVTLNRLPDRVRNQYYYQSYGQYYGDAERGPTGAEGSEAGRDTPVAGAATH
jgi:tyrosine-protein kinase